MPVFSKMASSLSSLFMSFKNYILQLLLRFKFNQLLLLSQPCRFWGQVLFVFSWFSRFLNFINLPLISHSLTRGAFQVTFAIPKQSSCGKCQRTTSLFQESPYSFRILTTTKVLSSTWILPPMSLPCYKCLNIIHLIAFPPSKEMLLHSS